MKPHRLPEKILRRLRVKPGGKFSLKSQAPDADLGLDKESAKAGLAALHPRLQKLQEVLYADARHAILVVLQAIDTGGKDGTIRHVFGPLNPQGVIVTSFKQPSQQELAHDYLWRIHQAVPAKGQIGVFNRSHYEDVLIARVHQLAPPKVIAARYGQINDFERHLTNNGVILLKLFLNLSRAEQKRRLESRLAQPDKHWKFSRADLGERERWDEYQRAFELMLQKCSTPEAPWHVIPADRKWARDLAVAELLERTMAGLKLRYPEPEPGLDQIVVPD